MTRRADPQRIDEARRAAVGYGLMDTGMGDATASRWCDAWKIEAAGRGLARTATIGSPVRDGSRRNAPPDGHRSTEERRSRPG